MVWGSGCSDHCPSGIGHGRPNPISGCLGSDSTEPYSSRNSSMRVRHLHASFASGGWCPNLVLWLLVAPCLILIFKFRVLRLNEYLGGNIPLSMELRPSFAPIFVQIDDKSRTHRNNQCFLSVSFSNLAQGSKRLIANGVRQFEFEKRALSGSQSTSFSVKGLNISGINSSSVA